MADAGNVTIRFSVQDAEVVRKALEQLGKDGEVALRKIDAAGQPPSGGLRALNTVIGDLNSRAMGLVAPLGGVGQGLVQLGPAGFLAAAALGGVIALFERVREGAKAFGQFSRDIRDQSEAAGLSASQYQALVAQLQQYGLEQEKASTALSRFAVHREEAARGSGELYNALRRENAALAEQFASARTSEQALNIFAQAIANAEMKTRAFLLNAAFGRGAELIGAALVDLAGKGGVGAVTEAMTKAGAVADETFIQKSAAAAVAAQQKAQLVERAWNQAYAAIYETWKDFKKAIGLGRRIVANYVIQKNAAELAARIQAGIAREDEIIVQRTEELYQRRARNIIKSDQELATAEAIVRKDALATAESLSVRSSETPALGSAVAAAPWRAASSAMETL
jgi:hypothetical protein